MIVINFWAGPGSGKSTAAAAAFVHLKSQPVSLNVELTFEFARELIYSGHSELLEDQMYVLEGQARKLYQLDAAGCHVAISDSPLLLSRVYGESKEDYRSVCFYSGEMWKDFQNINIWVERTKPYNTFGRMQRNVEEAKQLDDKIRAVMPNCHLVITGDEEGHQKLRSFLNESLFLFTNQDCYKDSLRKQDGDH